MSERPPSSAVGPEPVAYPPVADVVTRHKGICSRCGGTDNPRPLPKAYRCRKCGQRPFCYACDVTHGEWCPAVSS